MNEPVRVLQVIGRMNRGGAETMIMNLYRNIDNTRVQFDFVEHFDDKADFDDEIEALGGKIFRCPRYNVKNHFQYKKWWVDFFQKHSKEYVAVHGHIGSTASIYLSIAKKYGLYTIAHSHSTDGGKGLKNIIYKLLSHNTRNIADYFFGCSVAAGISRYGQKIVDNSKQFSVLKNAIDTSKYFFSREIKSDVRKEFNISDESLVICHIGRFDGPKNQIHLVKSFAKVQEIVKNSYLILVGDGPLKEHVENSVRELGITNSVIFTGIRRDVERILNGSDVFVFPSVFEGLPVTVIEAQTAGLPCLISDSITTEVAITDLVKFKSIQDSNEDWAREIIEISNKPKTDKTEEIIDAGYDIKSTSKWLSEFYCNIKKD